ncbi:MAG: DNA polymerase IV [Planctomycetes bacterium]|nr:DNA polymerase IV [Planctomycetota bacterium]
MTTLPDPASARTILHVDLDAFYAAVEVREQPSLRGRPVIVGADPKGGKARGVVSAASYEARRFGVHSAMPISRAWQLCPQGVFLPPRMELYLAVSARFMTLLERFTDLVEPLSVDEAFLDVTGSERLLGDGATIAAKIQAAVASEERLSASVGVAPSKFVAKIASDLRKPAGLVVVSPAPDAVRAFLAPLPIERLWGVGPKAATRLHQLEARTIGDVALLPLAHLIAAFGEASGRHLHDLAHGRDERAVEPEREAKSLGREHTFEVDVADRDEVGRMLLMLVEQLASRMRHQRLAGRTITVKLRTADFETVSRAVTLTTAVDTTESILPFARELLVKCDTTRQPIRLVGIALSHFGVVQPALFEPKVARQGRAVARTVDRLRERFGDAAITRGSLLDLTPPSEDSGPRRKAPPRRSTH